MSVSKLRLNSFTLIKLSSSVDPSTIEKLTIYQEDSVANENDIVKYRYSFNEDIVEEPRSKKLELFFWLIKNKKYGISFGEKRTILTETINLLDTVLSDKCERMTFDHDFLLNLINNRHFSNDVIGVKMESNDTGFIKSVSIDGQNLSSSSDFVNLLNTGNRLSKVVLEVMGPLGGTFVATIYNSGHILLSPYTKVDEIAYFIKSLIGEIK